MSFYSQSDSVDAQPGGRQRLGGVHRFETAEHPCENIVLWDLKTGVRITAQTNSRTITLNCQTSAFSSVQGWTIAMLQGSQTNQTYDC